MIRFDGFTVKNGDKSFTLGANINEVLGVLGLSAEKAVKVDEEMSYFSIDNVMLSILFGKCEFTFEDDRLILIEYVPSLKEYVALYGGEAEMTRDDWYACVDEAYIYLYRYMLHMYPMDMVDGDGLELRRDEMTLTVSKEREEEGIAVILEENLC